MAFLFYEIRYSLSSSIEDDFDEFREPDHSVITILGEIAHYNGDGVSSPNFIRHFFVELLALLTCSPWLDDPAGNSGAR